MNKLLFTLSFSAVAVLASAAGADDTINSPPVPLPGIVGHHTPDAPSPTVALPSLEPRRQGDITYVSGGVGEEGRAAIRAVEDRYNLRLLFAVAGSGAYVADVEVKLADQQGATVLDAVSDGPYFLAHVPPGRYQVTASRTGKASLTRSVQVAASGTAEQSFYWKALD